MVAFCSFSVLTTWPRVWIDEGKDIELARGFLNAGKLDIEMAPGQFSGVASLLQSTGYPVTVPLAGVFKLFGYGFEQARAYMLLWALIAIATVFFVSRKFLGNFNAIFSVLLIVTFASFYDSGRAVVGEIPGFVFLMAGLYFALYKDSYNKSGLFIGLSIVSKPSVFTWILPALVLVFAIEKKDFIIKTLKMSWGIILALFVWAILVLESLFSLSAWSGILNFYKNPYEGSSLISNFVTNLANAPYSTTLIYFGILFVAYYLFYSADFTVKYEVHRFAVAFYPTIAVFSKTNNDTISFNQYGSRISVSLFKNKIYSPAVCFTPKLLIFEKLYG